MFFGLLKFISYRPCTQVRFYCSDRLRMILTFDLSRLVFFQLGVRYSLLALRYTQSSTHLGNTLVLLTGRDFTFSVEVLLPKNINMSIFPL